MPVEASVASQPAVVVDAAPNTTPLVEAHVAPTGDAQITPAVANPLQSETVQDADLGDDAHATNIVNQAEGPIDSRDPNAREAAADNGEIKKLHDVGDRIIDEEIATVDKKLQGMSKQQQIDYLTANPGQNDLVTLDFLQDGDNAGKSVDLTREGKAKPIRIVIPGAKGSEEITITGVASTTEQTLVCTIAGTNTTFELGRGDVAYAYMAARKDTLLEAIPSGPQRTVVEAHINAAEAAVFNQPGPSSEDLAKLSATIDDAESALDTEHPEDMKKRVMREAARTYVANEDGTRQLAFADVYRADKESGFAGKEEAALEVKKEELGRKLTPEEQKVVTINTVEEHAMDKMDAFERTHRLDIDSTVLQWREQNKDSHGNYPSAEATMEYKMYLITGHALRDEFVKATDTKYMAELRHKMDEKDWLLFLATLALSLTVDEMEKLVGGMGR